MAIVGVNVAVNECLSFRMGAAETGLASTTSPALTSGGCIRSLFIGLVVNLDVAGMGSRTLPHQKAFLGVVATATHKRCTANTITLTTTRWVLHLLTSHYWSTVRSSRMLTSQASLTATSTISSHASHPRLRFRQYHSHVFMSLTRDSNPSLRFTRAVLSPGELYRHVLRRCGRT